VRQPPAVSELLAWGCDLGERQFDIGMLYRDRKGVAQDYAQAMHWLRLAANQGVADAQTGIGGLYDNGQGVVRDYV